jgi:hypothetical protein
MNNLNLAPLQLMNAFKTVIPISIFPSFLFPIFETRGRWRDGVDWKQQNEKAIGSVMDGEKNFRKFILS